MDMGQRDHFVLAAFLAQKTTGQPVGEAGVEANRWMGGRKGRGKDQRKERGREGGREVVTKVHG